MKKLALFLIITLLLTTFVLARAEVEKNVERDGNGSLIMTKNITTENGDKTITTTITRSCENEDNVTTCTKEMNKIITIERTNKKNETVLRSKNISVKTEWEIEVDDENNKTYVNFEGYRKEIKIMPDSASERALDRLRLKVCNESNNCTIILKDVGNNQTELKYELQVQRHYAILGIFKTKAEVRAQIGAETGNVEITKKPWWAFLASEQED